MKYFIFAFGFTDYVEAVIKIMFVTSYILEHYVYKRSQGQLLFPC